MGKQVNEGLQGKGMLMRRTPGEMQVSEGSCGKGELIYNEELDQRQVKDGLQGKVKLMKICIGKTS